MSRAIDRLPAWRLAAAVCMGVRKPGSQPCAGMPATGSAGQREEQGFVSRFSPGSGRPARFQKRLAGFRAGNPDEPQEDFVPFALATEMLEIGERQECLRKSPP